MRNALRFAAICGLASIAAAPEPPTTRKARVTDVFHGQQVSEDYRWLENWNDKEVRPWSDAQNGFARAWLDRLPDVPAIRARVTEIMSAKTISYGEPAYRKGTLFAIKREPPKQQPFVIAIADLQAPDQAKIVIDPNRIDSSGATSMDWYVPSPDGKLVAVSLSRAGTEAGDVHLFRTDSGEETGEVVPRVNTGTAGGDLAWMPDGSGFFYTRHPRAGERSEEDLDFYQQVYFHALNTPTEKDRYEIGKDFPRIAEIEFTMNDRTGVLLASVQNGDGGEYAHYLRSPSGTWTKISDFPDQVILGAFGPGDELFFVSRVGAPRGKIIKVSVSDPVIARATPVVAEGPDTIVAGAHHGSSSVLATDKRLYVLYQLGGPSELRVFDLAGKPLQKPRQLSLSSVGAPVKLEGDDILFSNTSFVDPPAWYRFRAERGETERTALATKSPVSFDDIEVTREYATSKDGTKIPVNILIPKGTQRNGTNPTVVTGYGGYGISLSPSFSSSRHVLLEQGFVLAVANLRGGGEFGEPWHRQGSLTHKQNVFDDFTAVLHHMIEGGYTSSPKLAIEGGSNGGLLMGALLTQHPDLMRAVVSHVGIYDMLRVELSPNGVFNTTEFGTVKDAKQFAALYAYSPYHHVREGVRYPAILFLTGANDPRVDAMQSRKMTARLQAATSSGEPILLRTSSNTGHGGSTGLSERIEQTVDVDAFLMDRLGVKFKAPASR